jgi:hypothetical protein
MDMPERLRPWLEREGLVERGHLPVRQALRALMSSLPTFTDARRLTDAVLERLGDRGALEQENGPQRWVYLRDPEDPQWLLAPALIDEQGWGPTGDVPEPPKDRIVPKGPDMHAGKLVLCAGATHFAVAFDAVGMRCGCELHGGDQFVNTWEAQTRPFVIDPRARPPTPEVYPLLLRADLRPDGHEVDELAGWIAELAGGLDADARYYAPSLLPLGSQAMLLRTRTSTAVALWQELVSPDARWLAVDGWCGRAFAAGATRQEALRGLPAELWRVKPGLLGTPEGAPLPFELPPPSTRVSDDDDNTVRFPTPPRTPEQGGPTTAFSKTISVSFGGFVSRHEWPKPDPSATPIVLYRVPAPPQVPERLARAGFRPIAVIGDKGRIGWVLRREDEHGWTLVGEGVAELVDPLELDAEIDAAEQAYADDWRELLPDGWEAQERPLLSRWSIWDNEHQRRGPLRFAGSAAGGFHPEQLDGASPWQLAHVRL